jgi:hypothetical protein
LLGAAVAAAASLAVYLASPVEQVGDLRIALVGDDRRLAALLTAAAVGALFLVARTLLPRAPSALIALGAALGTPLWTTASRALWSHTWALVFAGLGVLLLLRAQAGLAPWRPVLLGSVWSVAILFRPILALPLLAIAVLLIAERRARVILPFLATAIAWLAALVVHARVRFGTLLPPRFAIEPDVAGAPAALMGLLWSPSRGVVPYVPIVLFVAYASYRYPPRPALRPLRLLAAGVIAAHVLLQSLDPLWWGGHCFGPRLLTDVVPWLVLLAVLAIDGHRAAGHAGWTPLERTCAFALLAAAVAVHARGATVDATQEWNYRPRSVDAARERLWDWRRPQALAGWLTLSDTVGATGLVMGQPVDLRLPENEPYLGEGWSVGEAAQRWALGPAAQLAFALPGTSDGVLRLEAEPFLVPGRLDEQEVDVELNGQPVGTWQLRYHGFRTYSVRLPRSLQAPQDRVRLRFPDAAAPRDLGRGVDARRLAIAVRMLRVDPLPLLARGQRAAFGGAAADSLLGAGWSEPEERHRWTEGPQAELWFASQDDSPALLRMVVTPFLVPGRRERQRVRVELNGWTAAELDLTEGGAQHVAAVLPRGALAPDNLLRLHLPDAEAAAPGDGGDPRALGVALESLAIEDLPRFPQGGAIDPQSADAEAFLVAGWAWEDASRPSRRWALGPTARLVFALETHSHRVLRVDLEPFLPPAGGGQRVDLALNGVRLASLDLRRAERDTYPIALPPGVLARHNVLSLDLPDARSPEVLGLGDDPRRLGVVVHGVRLE